MERTVVVDMSFIYRQYSEFSLSTDEEVSTSFLLVSRLSMLGMVFVLTGFVCLADETAHQLAKEAEKAEKTSDIVKAYLLYSQAAAKDPKNHIYWAKSQALRTRALRITNALPASITENMVADPVVSGVDEDAPQVATEILKPEIEEARRPLPPKELTPVPGTRTFDLRGDAKSLFEQVTKAFGIDLVFDVDYQGGQPVRFHLENVDLLTAIHSLEAATGSFVVPLGEKLLMIYKDTQQKRTEAEPTMAVTLTLPNPITVQDAQELARAVQQILEIQRFAIDSSSRLVLIKDRVSKVRAAQELYQQLLTQKPQVMIEVEVMDTSESQDLTYGAMLPTSTAIAFLGRSFRSGGPRGPRIIPDIVPGFTRFVIAGGGLSTIALAIGDAALFATVSNSSSSSLYRTTIRALDSQAATIHIGDKYPIVTQQFQGGGGVNALATPSTFQFEDLGLSLKVTPKVHDSREVTVQVEAEFKVLGNETYNGIPVISTRKFASTVRLREGEFGLLAGLLSSSEARTISGFPLLGNLPILSSLLAQNTRNRTSSRGLVLIKPHIIDSSVADYPTRTIFTGSESRWNTLTQ